MFDLFSMENDSELDNIDVENSEIKNGETAVDAAAEKKEPTEVNISEEQSAHNEAASAGGCVVGDNEEQLSMDPIAAEESYIFERFGMSSEELDEAVDETIAEAEKIPEETETEDADLAATTVTDDATTQDVASEITVDSNATVPAAETTTDETVGDLSPDEEAVEQLKMNSMEGNLVNGALNVSAIASSTGLSSVFSALWTSCVSCGTFDDGSEILKSSKFKNKFDNFVEKYKNKEFPKLEDVKKDPRVTDKSGFWNWFFAGNAGGNKLKNMFKTEIKWSTIKGVPVAVTALDPITGSPDVRQLAGQKVIIVTGFYKNNNGTIKCKNICRGYIRKGAKVNRSGESLDDIFAAALGL